MINKHTILSTRGVTLIELVISLAITSLLASGLAAATMIAARSMPNRHPETTAYQEGDRWLRALQADLDLAIAQLPSTSNQCVLITGDQTGDGQPDRVLYAIVDNKLTRQVNNEAIESYVSASSLIFTEAVQQVTATYPGAMSWQPEQIVSRREIPDRGASESIRQSIWLGQIVQPSLPDNALAWRMTGLAIVGRPDEQVSSELTLKVYETDITALPTGSALAQVVTDPWLWGTDETYDPSGLDTPNPSIGGSSNGDHRWKKFTFGSPILRPIHDVLAITAENHSSTVDMIAELRVEAQNAWGLLYGPTWIIEDNQAMLHRVYGQAAIAGADITTERPHLRALHVTFIPTDGPAQQHMLSGYKLIPQHERIWLSTMNQSPLATDLNQDGTADWSAGSASAFNAPHRNNGVWNMPVALQTDSIDIDGETIIQARLRATSITGDGVKLTVSLDANAGLSQFGIIQVNVIQTDIGAQSIVLSRWAAGSSYEETLLIDGFNDDFIDLQLVLNPIEKAAALWANGVYRGTIAYTRESAVLPKRGLSLHAAGSAGEVDFVSIRVLPGGLN